MRIVGGRFRGRNLAAPSSVSIRPTSDRTRESLFNILDHRLGGDFSAVRVLDLFAGTGALGMEALSRGAQAAVFVENSVEARGILRSSIETFALTGVARILRRDATRLGSIGAMTPFNLVFADPPYGRGLGEKALMAALDGGWLHNDAILVLEETQDVAISLPGRFVLSGEYHYGGTVIRLYTLSRSGLFSAK